jgi:hypothetical protein
MNSLSALGVEVTAFVNPALRPPDAEPARPMGRPRKDAGHGAKRAARKSKKR